MKGSTAEARLETAKRLADLIEVPTDKLTDRDKKIIGLLFIKKKRKKNYEKDRQEFKDKKLTIKN